MTAKLTDRQQAILDYIRACVRERGVPPSVREIGEEFGIRSTNGVHGFLRALEKKGAIRRAKGLARSIELTEPMESEGALPLAGRIAAGLPIEAIEGQDFLDVPSLVSGPGRFALEVTGDSMIDAGIHNGDYVIIDPRSTARDGEIVVALLPDGEATLKYYYREGRGHRLEPANERYEPIHTDSLTIQGVVAGLYRPF